MVAIIRLIPLPLSLFLITVITRLPFTSKLLYHTDSVHFALALEKYDITLHQPHPPGYFFYVMLGRFLSLFINDANDVFIAISVVFSGLAIVAVYYLGKEIFDKKTGLISAAMAVTSPNFWFHGEVALSYIMEAFFSTVVAYLCWRIYKGGHSGKTPSPSPSPARGEVFITSPPLRGGDKGKGDSCGSTKYLWLSVIALGIAGGIRQNTLFFLFPLWLFSVRNLPIKKIALSLGLLGFVCLLWFVPMVWMTGGWEAYREAFRELWLFHTGRFSVFERGGESLVSFSSLLFTFTFYGIGAGIFSLGLAAYSIIGNNGLKLLDRNKVLFFCLWILPSVFFYLLIFIHSSNPGYALIFLPALFVLVAASVNYLSSRAKRIATPPPSEIIIASILVIANIGIFFFSNAPVSYGEIKSHDRELSAMLDSIRKYSDPDRSAVFVKPYTFFNFRHMMYYLPEYRVYQVDVRIAPTGERRKIFWGFKKKTFLTNEIIAPDEIVGFIVPLIGPHRAEAEGKQDISVTRLRDTDIYIASGHISLLKKIYPDCPLSENKRKRNL